MTSSRSTFTVIHALMLAGLAGCSSTPNAANNQILTGYQPELPVSRGATSKRLGPNEFRIMLDRNPSVDVQANSVWCWAASSAALLNYDHVKGPRGSTWTQDDVVSTIALHRTDQSGGEADVLLALVPELQARVKAASDRLAARQDAAAKAGKGTYDVDEPSMPNGGCIVSEIAQGRPVIVAIDPEQGELGHVVVAIGVRYSMASTDVPFGTTAPYFIWEIDAIDPRDGKMTKFLAFNQNPDQGRNAIDRVAFAVSRPLAVKYEKSLESAMSHPKWVPESAQPVRLPPPHQKTIKLSLSFGTPFTAS